MSNLQKDFIDSNDSFINRLAKLSQEEVKLPKNRDKFIQEEITIKSNLANDLGLSSFDNDYYNKQIKMKVREMAEDRNPLLSTRQVRMGGGLLENDDERYGMAHGGGPLPNEGLEKLHKEEPDLVAKMLKKAEGGRIGYKDGTDELYSKILKEKVSQSDYQRKISMGSMLAESEKQRDKIKDMKNEYESLFGIEYSQERKEKQEGGEIDNQMSMLMDNEQEMLPDEEMEDNYMDFILDEALTEEEEDMLMSKLEQDEQLSMLFDKVVEVASEFAGSGPVEGPGTGVSDSIPARLSDGEFVFTAKAVEEIGADELMRMMKDAEMRADERQGMANGGEAEEEDTVVMQPEQEPVRQDIRVTKETVGSQASMQEQQDLVDEEIKKGMLSNRPYVRS